eukprot:jgi/Mesen1/1777/ME000014S01192
MRKRERENPCYICGHYHKYEEGEVCAVCGHRLIAAAEKGPQQSAFSTEIISNFLYLGSYDNASRAELLKAQGISRILNTVPACQNLYRNSFQYHCLKDDGNIPFDECIQFIESSRAEGARVLVHCMSGQNRSPAVVIAYLMRHKGWKLPASFQHVKDLRPSIHINSAMAQQLQDYEAEVFGSDAARTPFDPCPDGSVTFGLDLTAHRASGSATPSPFGVAPSPPPPAAPSAFAFGSTSATPDAEGKNFVFDSAASGSSNSPHAPSDSYMDGA